MKNIERLKSIRNFGPTIENFEMAQTRKFLNRYIDPQAVINAIMKNESYFSMLYSRNKGQINLPTNALYKQLNKMPLYDRSLVNALKEESMFLYLRMRTREFMMTHFLKWLVNILFIYYLFGDQMSELFTSDEREFEFTKEKTRVTFDDLIGIDEFKDELMQIVDFLKDREKYMKVGAKVPKGVLLSGPPGCGKTQLARAVANEANLPFISLNSSELLNPIVGESQKKIRKLFSKARSSKKGAIIFIDEIDTLQSRSDLTGVYNSIQNELLTQLDGFYASDNILVIAATNREKVLDRALTRSGRFDFKITIRLPFFKNRIMLFDYYLAKVKHNVDVDVNTLAKLTVGFSPAEIKNMINKAAYHAINEKKSEIDQNDLIFAFERVKLGIKSKQMNDEKFRENAAIKEAAKAVFCLNNPNLPEIKKVSINSYSSEMIGKNIVIEKVDATNYSKQELLARVEYLLVAKAAEEIFLTPEKFSSLPRADLENASRIAQRFVGELGMMEEVTLSTIERDYLSDAGRHFIDINANRVLNERYRAVKQQVATMADQIKKVKEVLLEKEEISKAELIDAINAN